MNNLLSLLTLIIPEIDSTQPKMPFLTFLDYSCARFYSKFNLHASGQDDKPQSSLNSQRFVCEFSFRLHFWNVQILRLGFCLFERRVRGTVEGLFVVLVCDVQ
jgi:hypothetical protein